MKIMRTKISVNSRQSDNGLRIEPETSQMRSGGVKLSTPALSQRFLKYPYWTESEKGYENGIINTPVVVAVVVLMELKGR
jgi:hypothetical protein